MWKEKTVQSLVIGKMKNKNKSLQRSLFPSLFNSKPCSSELERYPERHWLVTCHPRSAYTSFFKHAFSQGRSRTCHKSKNHCHYLETLPMSQRSNLRTPFHCTTEKLQAEFVFKLCKLSMEGCRQLPWTQLWDGGIVTVALSLLVLRFGSLV